MGILIAIIISILLIYVNRFKEYMERSKYRGTTKFKIIDAMWRISLPLCFGILGFIWPIDLITYMTDDLKVMKEMAMTYSLCFIVSFFIMCILMIRLGKLKIDR